ncbi:predicted protein [Chaetoceros tenuissimus]|uniref:Uncharacterized protein n=1 Tax=Chaetoceros tenuissimus TaxID=426638 RepID=A0AAD3HAI4_9STRA|nr:predicted protein [Chaetoceros tenuissimus]
MIGSTTSIVTRQSPIIFLKKKGRNKDALLPAFNRESGEQCLPGYIDDKKTKREKRSKKEVTYMASRSREDQIGPAKKKKQKQENKPFKKIDKASPKQNEDEQKTNTVTIESLQKYYEAKHARLRFQLSDIKDQYEQSEKEQVALQQELETLHIQLDEMSNRMREIIENSVDRSVVEKKAKTISDLESKIATLENTQKTMKSEKESLSLQVEDLNNQIEKLQDKTRVQEDELKKVPKEQLHIQSVESVQSDLSRTQSEKFKLLSLLHARERDLVVMNQKLNSMTKEMSKVKQEVGKQMKEQRNLAEKDMIQMVNIEKKNLRKKIWDVSTQLDTARFKLAKFERQADERYNSAKYEFEEEITSLKQKHRDKVQNLMERLNAEEMFYAKAKMDFTNTLELIQTEFFSNKSFLDAIQKDESNKSRKNFLEEVTSARSTKMLNDLERKYSKEISSLEKTLDSERRQNSTRTITLEKKVENLTAAFKKEKKQILDEKNHELEFTKSSFSEEMDKMKTQLQSKISEVTKELNESKESARLEINELKANHIIEMESIKKIAAVEKAKLEEMLAEQNELIMQYKQERRNYKDLAKMMWDITKERLNNDSQRGSKRLERVDLTPSVELRSESKLSKIDKVQLQNEVKIEKGPIEVNVGTDIVGKAELGYGETKMSLPEKKEYTQKADVMPNVEQIKTNPTQSTGLNRKLLHFSRVTVAGPNGDNVVKSLSDVKRSRATQEQKERKQNRSLLFGETSGISRIDRRDL